MFLRASERIASVMKESSNASIFDRVFSLSTSVFALFALVCAFSVPVFAFSASVFALSAAPVFLATSPVSTMPNFSGGIPIFATDSFVLTENVMWNSPFPLFITGYGLPFSSQSFFILLIPLP